MQTEFSVEKFAARQQHQQCDQMIDKKVTQMVLKVA